MKLLDPHANLFEALTEFYTLLVQLAIVPVSMLHTPDPINGSDGFNAEAALEAGFSPEAVKLMAALPYVDPDGDNLDDFPNDGGSLEMMPSTQFIKLDRSDVIDFEWLRDIDHDPNDDRKIPGTVIRLSYSNIYGTVLLYDTETRLMREWRPFDSVDEWGYDSVTPKLPTDVLGPWIEKFRNLEHLSDSRNVHFHLEEDTAPNERLSEQRLASLEAANKYRKALLGLREIYRECGWDTDSKTQDGFDRGRFIKMRDRYYYAVLSPLEIFTHAFINGAHPTWEPVVEPWRDEL